jgi:hypothetical protein
MNSDNFAIQIIPDLSIDDKYAGIIEEALARINSFSSKALRESRLTELFRLEKSRLDPAAAAKILTSSGRLLVGFQFEARSDKTEDNFRVFVRKQVGEGQTFKFYLTPTVQQIMLQLISLEDRRTIAIFSMLNSSMEVGYRILTTLYSNQLRRLVERAPGFVNQGISTKIERLDTAKSQDDDELWRDAQPSGQPVTGVPRGDRPGTQDNILQVLSDDNLFGEINQYVGNIIARSDRIRSKRLTLEQNPDIPLQDMYEQMVREDVDQLENCYARMHIYLKAFYKNKEKRSTVQNRILRQFFGAQIEQITGETGLLEDLLSLSQDEYFRNIDRHRELE